MCKARLICLAFMVSVLAAFSAPAFGQLATQTVTLEPGWNSVFLEVQPDPKECDTVFDGMPVESVWAWNRHFSSVQFIQDLNTLVPEQPEWLTYFPPGSGKARWVGFFESLADKYRQSS